MRNALAECRMYEVIKKPLGNKLCSFLFVVVVVVAAVVVDLLVRGQCEGAEILRSPASHAECYF